jgi:hypothetical protein
MMNPLRCGSMPLRSRDNAWNVTTHTAARIAGCYCAINFNFGLQPSKENSAAPISGLQFSPVVDAREIGFNNPVLA